MGAVRSAIPSKGFHGWPPCVLHEFPAQNLRKSDTVVSNVHDLDNLDGLDNLDNPNDLGCALSQACNLPSTGRAKATTEAGVEHHASKI